jgi:hypothetical protein
MANESPPISCYFSYANLELLKSVEEKIVSAGFTDFTLDFLVCERYKLLVFLS